MNVMINTTRSACFTPRLVFIAISFLCANTMKANTHISPQDSLTRTMKVAKVYEERYSEPGSIQVTFYESARFYKILKSNPEYKKMVSLLKNALKKQEIICIRFAEPNGDVIDGVSKIKKNK